jgi:hypothetical protein
MNGGTQMRKMRLFAVAATLITTGLGAWAASTTDARIMSVKQLPAQHYHDLSFVFTIDRAKSGIAKIVFYPVRARINCSASAKTWGIILNVAVC